jgi:hypothetical protein
VDIALKVRELAIMTEEMIKQYLEHHFEPGTTKDFDVEP